MDQTSRMHARMRTRMRTRTHAYTHARASLANLKNKRGKKKDLAISYHFSTDFVLLMSLVVLANLYQFSILNYE